ncbi:hypothetical protein XENOCAPTIV_022663 [Xenoophorus captivus]|uniref:Uncharacterized protein n=1 Tax=Xenoophorus captivus TaxID=1517983 RepID=A0ABV0RA63_9TELE
MTKGTRSRIQASEMSLLYQMGGVLSPGDVRGNVNAQELYAFHMLHHLPLHAERSMFSLPGPPVIHYHFLGLASVQEEAVPKAPLSEIVDLMSVVDLIIVRLIAPPQWCRPQISQTCLFCERQSSCV